MKTNIEETEGRREVGSRNTRWADHIARWLASRKITPNQISILSILFSLIGGGALIGAILCNSFSLYIALVIYILGIQLRLLCNLFDGMVAVEGGKKTPNGDLYNDIPDRFSDALLIIPIGYLAGGVGIELGWLAALLAIMTAYFRWIGAFKTQKHFFSGPMAKQHRMALLTFSALAALFTIHNDYYHLVFFIALILMNIGLIATLVRRLYQMSRPISNDNLS